MSVPIPIWVALSAGVALLAPALAGAVELRLDGAWPEALEVDGELSEWTGEPDLVLGERDLGTRLEGWWRVSARGLVVAGRVLDDRVLLSGQDPNAGDRVEIWLSLPPATMPEPAWANGHGVHTFDPEDCEDPRSTTRESCLEWPSEVQTHRAWLARLFTGHYRPTAGGLQEDHAPRREGDSRWAQIPEEAVCCGDSAVTYRETDDGYTFEVLIGLEDFPATGELPLSRVHIALDLFDVDSAGAEPSIVLSTAPERDHRDPTSWPAVPLDPPLEPVLEPPVLRALLDARPSLHWFYFPAAHATRVFYFENLVHGDQRSPQYDSPEVTAAALGPLTPGGDLGDLQIFVAPLGPSGFWAQEAPTQVIVLRGEELVTLREAGHGAELVQAVERDGGVHLFFRGSHSHSLALIGPSAAADYLYSVILEVRPDGTVAELFEQGMTDCAPVGSAHPCAWTTVEEVELRVEGPAGTVTFQGDETCSSELDSITTRFREHTTWVPASASYVTSREETISSISWERDRAYAEAMIRCEEEGGEEECATVAYRAADTSLNEAYQHLLKAEDRGKGRKQAQRAWIAYRDAACDDSACKGRRTDDRTQELRRMAVLVRTDDVFRVALAGAPGPVLDDDAGALDYLRQLVEVEEALLASARAHAGDDPALSAADEAWSTFRDRTCSWEASLFRGTAGDRAELACQARVLRDRRRALGEVTDPTAVEPGDPGRTVDRLRLEEAAALLRERARPELDLDDPRGSWWVYRSYQAATTPSRSGSEQEQRLDRMLTRVLEGLLVPRRLDPLLRKNDYPYRQCREEGGGAHPCLETLLETREDEVARIDDQRMPGCLEQSSPDDRCNALFQWESVLDLTCASEVEFEERACRALLLEHRTGL